MKWRAYLLISAALLAPAISAAQTPGLFQIDLFKQGDGGVNTYRIPALVQSSKGTLIAVSDALTTARATCQVILHWLCGAASIRELIGLPSRSFSRRPRAGLEMRLCCWTTRMDASGASMPMALRGLGSVLRRLEMSPDRRRCRSMRFIATTMERLGPRRSISRHR